MPRLVTFVALILLAPRVVAAPETSEREAFFVSKIQPLLANRCYDCHGPDKAKGGLRLTSLKNALAGGESGEPAIKRSASAEPAALNDPKRQIRFPKPKTLASEATRKQT